MPPAELSFISSAANLSEKLHCLFNTSFWERNLTLQAGWGEYAQEIDKVVDREDNSLFLFPAVNGTAKS